MSRELSADTTLSHYRIVSQLGAGGMGEVWLAEDTRLKRKVALKLLPAELTADAERVRRFEQEAQAASALNHPNIITVYDIGESEAGRFIVMELVAGRTLRAVIAEDNSLETLLALGQQMAKALAAAHAAGITHRDIKPDNIMVREDGYVKVLDFGLARLRAATESDADAATLAQQTTPGTVMGTVAYMSPEQARGERVSHPSDIFALGIVLYELATGRHPFKAETLVGYLHAITLQEPPPSTQWKPELPVALNELILRMLSKDASQRPTACEVAQTLQDVERRGTTVKPQSNEDATMMLPAAPTGTSRADEGFWVAVLPFKWRGANAELEALAEGLSEDIVTGLSRFSYLRVIARGSTLRFTSETLDVRAIGKQLGARYVMEGSLRQSGTKLRLAVQLADATTGAHLWAENYDRSFSPETVFELQDDLVPRIVSTCADHFGVLARCISDTVRWKDTRQLSPYEGLMRGFGYHHRLTPAEHAVARDSLERAVEQSPNNADCWAMLSWVYSHEYGHGFNPQSGSLDRALAAAQRAVDLAPSNHLAYQTLAVAFFFRKEKAACLSAAERAMALNPLDASNEAIFLVTFTGDWERGCALIKRAMELNPHHPGWYRWVLAVNEYRKLNYREAVDGAIQANSPGIFWTNMLLAAAYGQLGELKAAREALENLLRQKEDFAQSAREEFGKWFDAELTEHLIDGLRKAGLAIAGEEGSSTHSPATEIRAMAESSPSIAVLPFGNLSPDPDNEFFADGLTEEVIADLSVIRALRVISRTSAMRFKGTNKDLRAIARELDVRYLLEGSVRRAGTSLRITAQLIDAENDSHLWAEKYTGNLEDVFAIQEEISRKIVKALQLRLTDAETRGMAERPIDNAAAYDCYLRARHEMHRFTAEGLDRAQQLADAGLTLIGENPLLLATRGMVSWYYLNFSIRPDESYLDEAAAYAARALAQDAQSYAGIFLRGLVASKRGDIESAIRDVRLAREQKPGDAVIVRELMRYLFSAGQEHSELAGPVYEEALRLDLLHPLNWAQVSWRHFSAGRLAEAAESARRILHLTEQGNPARVYAGYYLALANQREEAIAAFEAEGKALSGTAYGAVSLFLSRALQQDAAGAVRHVTPQLEQAASWTEYLALFLADGYALIGHQDDALRWLRKAVGLGFINYPYLATHDPFLANVRSDRRCLELLREVKARWEALSQNRPRPMFAQLSEALTESDQALPEREEFKTQTLPSGTSATNRENVQSDNLPITTPNLNSIAVLPFANISADEENEYFCDGLAEELLNALAKIDELKVAARTSAFSFKGKNAEAREIGKMLNVNTVLEGSVRKAGNRIRINVQLVNAADGYQLWSERYDREMKDIFDVQDEITLAVVDALKVKLLGAKKAAVTKRYTENVEAYQLYLKGRYFWFKFNPPGWIKARECFEQALQIDPNFVLAYTGLADVLGVSGLVTLPGAVFPQAMQMAQKALQLDPGLSEAWASRAALRQFYEWDWAGAESDLKQAIKLNPRYVLSHDLYAIMLAALGRHEEALAEAERSCELDPLSSYLGGTLGIVLYFARRFEEAEAQLLKSIELDPAQTWSRIFLIDLYEQLEKYAEALQHRQQLLTLAGNTVLAAELGQAFQQAGYPGVLRRWLTELQKQKQIRYVSALDFAAVYVRLGEHETALDWLESAFAERSMYLLFLKEGPCWEGLSAHPHYTELLRRIGLPANSANQPGKAQTIQLSLITEGKQAGEAFIASASLRHTVGREPERNELRAAFKTANGGRGSLLCVAGEPGIGKTTLVEDFLAELAAERQCTIARGRCSERLAGTEAYLPLLVALESLLQTDKSLASTMKQLAPTWYAQVAPLNSESEESSRLLNDVKAASQERMKRELAAFLQAVSEAQPLVIFFDDLHWADISTIDLLSFLAGKFDALRVLIVTTYRPSDMLLAKHPFLQIKPDLQARGLCRELSLEFLTEAEIADYLTLEFPRHAFPPDFAKLIHAKTEGSPLFMADLVRYLRDRNVIAQSSGSWKLEQTLPDIERELPESVRGMIERKIGQLGEEDRKLLTAASVQGYEFDSAVVAKVLKLDEDEVEERLERLERVFAFVKLASEAEFPNRTLTLKYRFVHVLYQNALYAALRITRKASLSREVAQTMEGFYGEQRTSVANQLAALYEGGRESARAADYYRLAAEHDTRVAAYQEAVVLARRGLGLLKSEPDTTARTRQELALQITLSVPLGACRGLASQESRELFTRARELAQQLGDPPELLTIMYGQWRSYLIGGDNRTALKLGEEFLALARTKAPAAMTRAHQIMASALKYRGEFTSAYAHTKELLAIWNSQPRAGEAVVVAAENPAMIGLFIGAWSLWKLGYPDQALQQSREALALARQEASPYGLALATFMAAELHISRRETQRVRELAEDCLAICTEHGFPQWLANGYICRGWALVEAGQGAAGVAEMREGVTAMHATEADLQRSRYLALLGEACGATGQLAEGLSLLAEALAFAEQSGERFFEAEIHRLRGELLLKSEAPQAAVEECFHQAIKVAQRQQAKSLELRAVMSLARLWRQQGKREEARLRLAEIYGWFTEGFDTADLQEAKALLDELR